MRRMSVLWSVVLFLAAAAAPAQVMLELDTVALRWPMVDIRLHAECRRAPAVDLERRYFRVRENGREVTNFTLSCPDSTTFCPMSVALVFDVSGSMQGTPLDEAKDAGRAFVNHMIPGIDEVAILTFEMRVHVMATMTSNTGTLLAAIDSMKAFGGTAAWNAGMAALKEVDRTGINPCRAVILLTDGEDNGSVVTPDELIDSSLAYGIPIYTIALGTFHSAAELERIALATGGRYYNVEGPSGLDDIYVIIANVIKFGSASCTLTYTGACIDGGDRNVEIMLAGYCEGGDTASITFRAPDNTGRILPVDIAAGSRRVRGGATAFVPVTLQTTLAGDLMYPFDLLLRYDSSLLHLRSAAPAPGSWLTAPPDILPAPEGALLRTRQIYAATGSGDFLVLEFEAANPADTVCTGVALERWWFSEGCMEPRLHDGQVCIAPCHLAAVIAVPPPGVLCPGARLLLATDSGAYTYAWSRNDTAVTGDSPVLEVSTPGSYTVTISDSIGCSATSPPVLIPAEAGLSLRVSTGGLLVAAPGSILRIPLAVNPPLHPGQPLSVIHTIVFDPALLVYDGFEEDPASPWMERHVETVAPGSVRLDCDGFIPDTLRTLYTLRFRVTASPHAPVATTIDLASGFTLSARCLDSLSAVNPAVVIDGSCVHLARSPLQHPAVAVHPNPFRNATDITVTLPSEGHATLKVVSVLGGDVALLADGILPAGPSSFRFSAGDLPAGAYRLLLFCNGELRTRALQVVK